MALEIVRPGQQSVREVFDVVLALEHHQSLIERYLQSHRIRNHSAATIKKEGNFLRRWFESQGFEYRPLLTWEAMDSVDGRRRIRCYNDELLKSELHPKTIRSHLGTLKKYFAFVLEYPFVQFKGSMRRLDENYGMRLAQPISEFDIPHHSYDGEDRGIPLDPENLYDFYRIVLLHYLDSAPGYKKFKARNYTMLVVAGESGLRANELSHLHISDLFFESNKIQTRHAKATRGSGKRARVSLFTAFAQDSVRHYLKLYRHQFGSHKDLLFPTSSGRPMPYQIMNKELKQMVGLAQQAGFPVLSHLSWHWLRRIFATRYIEKSPDKLPVLIKLLGHTGPNSVHRYIHHSEAWMDRQIQETLQRGF